MRCHFNVLNPGVGTLIAIALILPPAPAQTTFNSGGPQGGVFGSGDDSDSFTGLDFGYSSFARVKTNLNDWLPAIKSPGHKNTSRIHFKSTSDNHDLDNEHFNGSQFYAHSYQDPALSNWLGASQPAGSNVTTFKKQKPNALADILLPRDRTVQDGSQDYDSLDKTCGYLKDAYKDPFAGRSGAWFPRSVDLYNNGRFTVAPVNSAIDLARDNGKVNDTMVQAINR